MPAPVLAKKSATLRGLRCQEQPFRSETARKRGRKEATTRLQECVVKWSRSTTLEHTPLDTAAGQGLLGPPAGSGCPTPVGRALPEVPPEATERRAENERVRQWMQCSRGMRARGAAYALQLGMPTAGARGGCLSRTVGAAGRVDWGCWSTKCRVHSAHRPSAGGHTPAAHKFAATSSPRSLKLLATLGLAPAGKLAATRGTRR